MVAGGRTERRSARGGGSSRHVVLFGPPGAGKGAQARLLRSRRGLLHFSMGDALREEIARGTEMGLRIRRALDAGGFADDATVQAVVTSFLAASRAARGWVLDGFPRTVEQAQWLEANAGALRARLERAFLLEAPEAVLLERLRGRRVCGACGRTYHLAFGPPRRNGICDGCGGRLVERADDAPSVQKRRLEIYHARTRPLVEFYQARGVLRVVDARGTVGDVSDRLVRLLDGPLGALGGDRRGAPEKKSEIFGESS